MGRGVVAANRTGKDKMRPGRELGESSRRKWPRFTRRSVHAATNDQLGGACKASLRRGTRDCLRRGAITYLCGGIRCLLEPSRSSSSNL